MKEEDLIPGNSYYYHMFVRDMWPLLRQITYKGNGCYYDQFGKIRFFYEGGVCVIELQPTVEELELNFCKIG